MRKATAALALVVLMAPSPASAWGFETHKFVVSRAIDMLPDAIRPFFQANRVFVIEHVIDPDLWRTGGLGFADEAPRHFLDMDAYGTYPFKELPRDYDEAVAKFGADMVKKNGVVPWRSSEIAGRLRTAFEGQKQAPYAQGNVRFFSAIVAHYVSDAHVPFHAAKNYNGQLSGQFGIHDRFEEDLYVRYGSRLTIQPPPLASIPNLRDFIFDTLLDSFQDVDAVFAADSQAIGDAAVYDDRYYDAFFAQVQPILERRLGQAISSVASVITSEWERAGRPALLVNPPPRPPAQRRRANP